MALKSKTTTPIPKEATTEQILLLNILHNQMAIMDTLRMLPSLAPAFELKLIDRYKVTNQLVYG
jgi:hypothetical protein